MSLAGLQTNTSGKNRWMPNPRDLTIQEQNNRRDEQRDIQEAYEMGNPLLANYLEMKLAKKTGDEALVKRINDEEVVKEAQKRLIRKRMKTPRGGITQSLPGPGFIPQAPPIPIPQAPPFIPQAPPLPPPQPFIPPILRPVRRIPPAPPLPPAPPFIMPVLRPVAGRIPPAPPLPPPPAFRMPVLRPVVRAPPQGVIPPAPPLQIPALRPINIPRPPPVPRQPMLYGRPFVVPRLRRTRPIQQEQQQRVRLNAFGTNDAEMAAWNRDAQQLNDAMDAHDNARAQAAVIRAQQAREQYENRYGPTLGRTPTPVPQRRPGSRAPSPRGFQPSPSYPRRILDFATPTSVASTPSVSSALRSAQAAGRIGRRRTPAEGKQFSPMPTPSPSPGRRGSRSASSSPRPGAARRFSRGSGLRIRRGGGYTVRRAKTIPSYTEFGSYVIDPDALESDKLRLKYKSGLSIRGFPNRKVNSALSAVIKKMLKDKRDGKSTWGDITELDHLTDKLQEKDMALLLELCSRAKIFRAPQHKSAVVEHNDKLVERLNLMVAEIQAGNNSPVMKQQLIELATDLRRKNRLSKEHFTQISSL